MVLQGASMCAGALSRTLRYHKSVTLSRPSSLNKCKIKRCKCRITALQLTNQTITGQQSWVQLSKPSAGRSLIWKSRSCLQRLYLFTGASFWQRPIVSWAKWQVMSMMAVFRKDRKVVKGRWSCQTVISIKATGRMTWDMGLESVSSLTGLSSRENGVKTDLRAKESSSARLMRLWKHVSMVGNFRMEVLRSSLLMESFMRGIWGTTFVNSQA